MLNFIADHLACRRRAGPLRIDPATVARRNPATITQYRRALLPFLAWCQAHQVHPIDTIALDDLIVEFKNQTGINKHEFINLIAAVKLAWPAARNELPWNTQVMKDWEVTEHINHHIPIPFDLAILVAVVMSHLGFARLAAGLIIAQQRGLRPSEYLRLRPEDVTLPECLAFGNKGSAVMNLGQRTGTKAKRSQAVLVDAKSHAESLLLLRVLVASTPLNRECAGGKTLAEY